MISCAGGGQVDAAGGTDEMTGATIAAAETTARIGVTIAAEDDGSDRRRR